MGDRYKYGIGFWAGGGVHSIINMLMKHRHALQSDVLLYNYGIAAVAIVGMMLNAFMLKRSEGRSGVPPTGGKPESDT